MSTKDLADRSGRLGVVVIIIALVLSIAPHSMTAVGATSRGPLDLDDSAASFRGDTSSMFLGYSVANIGDVNGDGYDDLAAGAYQYSQPSNHEGKVYLFFGNGSGWDANISATEANASFLGQNADDWAGSAVAGPGDVNGDGYDDILIGAPRLHWDLKQDVGITYLIFGKANGWTMDASLGDADASFVGEYDNDNSGSTLGGVGDVNGDGFMDFMIGTEQYSTGGSDIGVAYLIFGKSNGWGEGTELAGADAKFTGHDANDQLGTSISGGDVNGDGLDDILIGADNDEGDGLNGAYCGVVYVYFGRLSNWMSGDISAIANASFEGQAGSHYAGRSVDSPGDINGDGIDDIIIGANGIPSTRGGAYVVFGKESGWTDYGNLGDADAYFYGEEDGDKLGTSVSGAGDVNGDGLADFILGAPGYFNGASNAGKVYLYLGKEGDWSDYSIDDADVSYVSVMGDDQVGYSLSGGGDMNGDGLDDIVLGAPYSDDGLANRGKVFLVYPFQGSRPANIASVTAFSDPGRTNEMTTGAVNDTVYVELQGTGSSAGTPGVAIVWVSSSTSSPLGFRLKLYETGADTDIFVGNFTIMNRTHRGHRWIKATLGETVYVTSDKDGDKEAAISVGEVPITLLPDMDTTTVKEDEFFEQHFWTAGRPATSWDYESNASWLSWDSVQHNVSGTPDNGDVGEFNVYMKVTDNMAATDEINFTITVENTPPEILTGHVYDVDQGTWYEVDYNSSDDGNGTVTWHIGTNASWLDMNSTTGVLSGMPTNGDVGWQDVDVIVDDGNGGTNSSSFRVNVTDVNDAPYITTVDLTTTMEDELYDVTYAAIDNDTGDQLTWSFSSSGDWWLEFDDGTHQLSGTPDNGAVGTFWVNVTVKDVHGVMDIHNFTLEVVNVNDDPVITSAPPVYRIGVLQTYSYQVEATDVDLYASLTFSLDDHPANMSINGTGAIEWTPAVSEVGTHHVVVNVSDGEAFDLQAFDLNVTADNIPIITSDPVTSALIGKVYTYQVKASGGNETNYVFSLDDAPDGMTINSSSGLIDWSPSYLLDGQSVKVVVSVNDGSNTATQTFTIDVTMPGGENHRPMILSQPERTKVKVDKEFTYRVIVSDDDISDIHTFVLSEAPTGMTIDKYTGLINWTPGKGDVGTHEVTVNVSDGKGGFDEQSFTVKVEKESGPTTSGLDNLFLIILLVVIVVVVVAILAVVVTRKKAPPVVDEGPRIVIDDIFLVYKDGRMISHHTRQLKPDMDDDLLGGMFTAVQEFIKTSMGGDDGQTINEIGYGDKRILIEHGQYIFLAAVMSGDEKVEVHAMMKDVVHNIEVDFGTTLQEWDGDTKTLKDAKKWVQMLISGEKVERLAVQRPRI